MGACAVEVEVAPDLRELPPAEPVGRRLIQELAVVEQLGSDHVEVRIIERPGPSIGPAERAFDALGLCRQGARTAIPRAESDGMAEALDDVVGRICGGDLELDAALPPGSGVPTAGMRPGSKTSRSMVR